MAQSECFRSVNPMPRFTSENDNPIPTIKSRQRNIISVPKVFSSSNGEVVGVAVDEGNAVHGLVGCAVFRALRLLQKMV